MDSMVNNKINKGMSRNAKSGGNAGQNTGMKTAVCSFEDFGDYFDYEIMLQFRRQQQGGVK